MKDMKDMKDIPVGCVSVYFAAMHAQFTHMKCSGTVRVLNAIRWAQRTNARERV